MVRTQDDEGSDRHESSGLEHLADEARDAVSGVLQDTLVDLVDLSLVAKQAHWNLVGGQFHDVHLHLDEPVETARNYAD